MKFRMGSCGEKHKIMFSAAVKKYRDFVAENMFLCFLPRRKKHSNLAAKNMNLCFLPRRRKMYPLTGVKKSPQSRGHGGRRGTGLMRPARLPSPSPMTRAFEM